MILYILVTQKEFIMPRKQLTTSQIRGLKHTKKIVMITAYDALFAKIFDEFADMILVGDSLNMSFGGKRDTLEDVSMEQMIYHAKAVCRGAKEGMVVLDMPFGTYTNETQAIANATLAITQSSVSAVKIEGGTEVAPIVKKMVQNSIAVMGHIGLLPQKVRLEGGYVVQGKTAEDARRLVADAKALQEAGVFAIVCEGVKKEVATQIANSVDIPIIGIGAGNGVDGQVLVWSDLLGLYDGMEPKFLRKYLDGISLVKEAVKGYKEDVESGDFPNESESYL